MSKFSVTNSGGNLRGYQGSNHNTGTGVADNNSMEKLAFVTGRLLSETFNMVYKHLSGAEDLVGGEQKMYEENSPIYQESERKYDELLDKNPHIRSQIVATLHNLHSAKEQYNSQEMKENAMNRYGFHTLIAPLCAEIGYLNKMVGADPVMWQGNFKKALKYYEEIISRPASSTIPQVTADALYGAAVVSVGLDKKEEALEYFEEVKKFSTLPSTFGTVVSAAALEATTESIKQIKNGEEVKAAIPERLIGMNFSVPPSANPNILSSSSVASETLSRKR